MRTMTIKENENIKHPISNEFLDELMFGAVDYIDDNALDEMIEEIFNDKPPEKCDTHLSSCLTCEEEDENDLPRNLMGYIGRVARSKAPDKSKFESRQIIKSWPIDLKAEHPQNVENEINNKAGIKQIEHCVHHADLEELLHEWAVRKYDQMYDYVSEHRTKQSVLDDARTDSSHDRLPGYFAENDNDEFLDELMFGAVDYIDDNVLDEMIVETFMPTKATIMENVRNRISEMFSQSAIYKALYRDVLLSMGVSNDSIETAIFEQSLLKNSSEEFFYVSTEKLWKNLIENCSNDIYLSYLVNIWKDLEIPKVTSSELEDDIRKKILTLFNTQLKNAIIKPQNKQPPGTKLLMFGQTLNYSCFCSVSSEKNQFKQQISLHVGNLECDFRELLSNSQEGVNTKLFFAHHSAENKSLRDLLYVQHMGISKHIISPLLLNVVAIENHPCMAYSNNYERKEEMHFEEKSLGDICMEEPEETMAKMAIQYRPLRNLRSFRTGLCTNKKAELRKSHHETIRDGIFKHCSSCHKHGAGRKRTDVNGKAWMAVIGAVAAAIMLCIYPMLATKNHIYPMLATKNQAQQEFLELDRNYILEEQKFLDRNYISEKKRIQEMLDIRGPYKYIFLDGKQYIRKLRSVEELSKTVGFSVSEVENIPFEVRNVEYLAKNDGSAEIAYFGELGKKLYFNKSRKTEGNFKYYNRNISGYKFKKNIRFLSLEATILKKNEEEAISAIWTDGASMYSLNITEGTDEASMVHMAESLIKIKK